MTSGVRRGQPTLVLVDLLLPIVLWGAALIAEAGVQVLMAYTLPVDIAPLLITVQWFVVLILLQVITQVYVRLPGVKRLL